MPSGLDKNGKYNADIYRIESKIEDLEATLIYEKNAQRREAIQNEIEGYRKELRSRRS
ncbi:hypothetical protein RFF05_11460 [Bengtsoniella intestinalis]|uniref:hypothetical protein n=1 Tax=Bengtsoniella intestinalis TaxID=3073143 RepID=UPI00391F3217